MTRREALVFAAAAPWVRAQSGESVFGAAQGVGVVAEVATGRLLWAHRTEVARTLLAPPGSTVKPLALLALLHAGKLRADWTHLCTGSLMIGGRSYACSHPRMSAPVDLPTSLAYSCNEYVAQAATRFSPGELAGAFARFGLASRSMLAEEESSGQIGRANSTASNQLQALGEQHVEITVLQLCAAYRRVALDVARPESAPALAPILEGLEGAVKFGTAQHAAIAGVSVAGKTGTAARRFAWFAGFAPSRSPRVVCAVLVQGRAGGADAAPIGGRLLAAHLRANR